MNDFSSNYATARSRVRPTLVCLLGAQIIMCCCSLIYVAQLYARYQIAWFDTAHIFAAAVNTTAFAIVATLFTFSRFSFGYLLGFYFYTMVLGYLWLAAFSQFNYDHTLASVSALVSAVAFLVPALFITSPIKQRLVLPARAMDYLLSFILIMAAIVLIAGAFHHFKLVSIANIYDFRDDIELPGWLRYAVGTMTNALLPFAFACFVQRKERWRAAVALLFLLLFYPITLTKLALFGPAWILFLALLSRVFESRLAVVLSLLLPLSIGVLSVLLVKWGVVEFVEIRTYFGAVNFRMIAMPSIALDLYNDFFSTHVHTHFCQILFLKPFVICPYTAPLSVMMAEVYHFGNLNASLFATEGSASVGPILTPVVAFTCGLITSLANRLSSGLPPRFILLSGGVLSQILLNVPFSTTMLSNGAAILFLLWYITPRAMFEPKQSGGRSYSAIAEVR